MDAAARRATTAETTVYVSILLADPCCYCGSRGPIEIDHVDPIAAGGQNSWENVTAACKSCNRRKSSRPLLVWLLEL